MVLMSSKVGRDELRPGDHIYTGRRGSFYSHHGIYVGGEKVIHLTRRPGLIRSSLTSKFQPSNDHVVCCTIPDFVSDRQVYRFEYGDSNIPPEEVLDRATYHLMNGFPYNYDFVDENGENFAFYCKTGFVKFRKSGGDISEQIRALFAAYVAITIIPYGLLPASLIGQALVVCGLYCFLRLCFVVESRSDYQDDSLMKMMKMTSTRRTLHRGDYQDVSLMKMMKMTSTRRTLHRGDYLGYALWVIRIWGMEVAPESKILIWLKSFFLYAYIFRFLAEHLRRLRIKLEEYSAYTIWVLGYLYWRWTSVSTILLWTRLFFLYAFVWFFIPDPARQAKLAKYVIPTTWVLELWNWDRRITIHLWIKLALVVYFVIQSAELFRITKNNTFL